jgi:hypothetical protein
LGSGCLLILPRIELSLGKMKMQRGKIVGHPDVSFVHQDRILGGGAGRGGRTPGRGGRGGRGGDSVPGGLLPPHDTRKRSSDEASLSEASPTKDNTAQNPPLLLEWKAPGVVEPTEHEAAKKKSDFGGGQASPAYVPRSGTLPPPPSAREQKRSRKSGTPKKDKNARSAGSSGE